MTEAGGTGGVRVEGARELRRTLRKAGHDLNDLKDAHQAAGSIVLNDARPRTPRGFTGRLQASQRQARAATFAEVRAGNARVPYAGPVHWGWPARNIAAQPWLADSAKRTEPQWTAAYEAAVNRVLDTIQGANTT